ncbi:MAG: DotI/IcmL/TraM family protein [Alphaproteobacteria bacterium]
MGKVNLVLNIFLICAVGFLIFRQHVIVESVKIIGKSKTQYFATTNDGRLVQMIPLDQPLVSETSLLSWVQTVSIETLSLNSNNYHKSLLESSTNYTKKGWNSVTSWLHERYIIHDIKNKKITLKASALSGPRVISEENVSGRYQWIIDMPIVLKLGDNETKYNLNIMVVRASSLESVSGVAIEKITFSRVI